MLRQHIPPEKAQTEMQNVVRIKSPCTKAQMHVVLHSLSLCERECVCVRKREESVLCANVMVMVTSKLNVTWRRGNEAGYSCLIFMHMINQPMLGSQCPHQQNGWLGELSHSRHICMAEPWARGQLSASTWLCGRRQRASGLDAESACRQQLLPITSYR